ncbi:FAD-dependent oxidoreductase [Oceanispirochaeta sp. M2]|uniref:flavin monoamine oxidase family protein n=1 Tax=Oceanispirochaeta sp. M2 TaxID=2735869 RepID=UPI0015575C76|nr:FAD-dependent oxidoreductase [Oceanispirochaeta sp. M2]MBF9016028.1 FAD-dependent oxidoreductase [Oceanispirochaeta sp. M2]
METTAVIGAGYSGLITAYQLQKAGYDVTVFEKADIPGGQCHSLPAGGGIVELGCVFGTSPALEELCHDLEVKVERNYFYRQYLDNHGQKIPQLDETAIQKFKDEYKMLPSLLSKYDICLNTPGFYNIPEELKMNFKKWCSLHDIEVLTEIFSAYFSCYGYGELDTIPAVYVLKHLDLSSLSSLVESRKIITFPQGSSSICNALAQKLSDIRYNSEVLEISNADDESILIKTELSSEQFSRVIITTPLKSGIVSHPFFSRALDTFITNPSNTLVYRIPSAGLVDSFVVNNTHKDGKLRLIHVNSSNSEYQMISVYSNGYLEMKELDLSMRESLSSMGIDSAVLTASKKWNFFPHVESAMLYKGFYEELQSRQGEKGIYLGGALSCCSSLDKITEFTSAFIHRYF